MLKSTWWPFIRKSKNIHFELQTFFGSRVKIRIDVRGGISQESSKMYIMSCKLPLCFSSGVKIRINHVNVRGGISPGRPKPYI